MNLILNQTIKLSKAGIGMTVIHSNLIMMLDAKGMI